jgi:tRNA pseudouridine55 synthase
MSKVPMKQRLPRVPVHGVILLDKPVGFTSNDALMKVKGLLRALKAGHTGTLDPFATGLLPLCFGEATKFSHDLLEADKTYETVVHLGVATTTGDNEGEVIATKPVDVSVEQINTVLAQFRGPINQVPPMYSALKRDGKPLYEYARAGVTLERDARPVTIHALELLDYTAPLLRLRVTCSKGTYIRVLGEDIGNMLGCGAHLQALRRLAVGALTLDNSVTIDTLVALEQEARVQWLQPVDSLLATFPAVLLPEVLAKRFLHGQRIALEKEGIEVAGITGRVRVYRQETAELLGTANVQEYALLAPERLISTVIM